MEVDIQTRNFVLTEGLRSHVQRRLFFAMARFQGRVQRITVRLSDTNGPRGGLDKCCHLQIRVDGVPDIVVSSTEKDLYAAISGSAERAGQSLRRYLKRGHGALTRSLARGHLFAVE